MSITCPLCVWDKVWVSKRPFNGGTTNEQGAGNRDNVAKSSHDFCYSGKHIKTLDDLLRTVVVTNPKLSINAEVCFHGP